jgi:hypothetical protein
MRRPALACSILALCVPAAALADGSPHAKTLTGTLTGTPSGLVTVTSGTATLTCMVPDRAAASVARLKLGVHVKIACRSTGGALVLTALKPITSHDDHQSQSDPGGSTGTGSTGTGSTGPGSNGDGSSKTGDPGKGGDSGSPAPPPGGGDHGSGTTPTTTTPTTTAPPPKTPPPPPPPQQRDAVGIVFFLSSTGIAVRPDAGGPVLTCAISPAPDSVAAAAKLTLNGHFGIVCRLDGTHWVLSGATPVK